MHLETVVGPFYYYLSANLEALLCWFHYTKFFEIERIELRFIHEAIN